MENPIWWFLLMEVLLEDSAVWRGFLLLSHATRLLVEQQEFRVDVVLTFITFISSHEYRQGMRFSRIIQK